MTRPEKAAVKSPRRGSPRIFDLWLAGWTQQEIASIVAAPQKTVDDTIKSFSEYGTSAILAKSDRAAAEHATDFDLPIEAVIKSEPKVLTKWREAMKPSVGRKPKSVDNVNALQEVETPKGNSKAYTLTRLEKDHPEPRSVSHGVRLKTGNRALPVSSSCR